MNLTRCGVRAVVAPAVRGGRGRRGRAGGHGARARHERWQQWRGQSGLAAATGAGVAGAAPVAGPDKIIDPCTGGAGSHGSSRPPVTRRAVASPLTSNLSPLGPAAGLAREGSSLQIPPLSQICSGGAWGDQAEGGGVQRLSTLNFGGWRVGTKYARLPHCVCLSPPFVTFQISSPNTSIWGHRGVRCKRRAA